MYLFSDIGATNIRLGLSSGKDSLGPNKIFPTPQSFAEGVSLIEKVSLELSQGAKIEGAVLGIAGPLNKQKSMLTNSPGLPNWIDQPLKDTLQDHFGVPVFLENDSALVGLGEAVFGAGEDEEIVVYITISTGVGGVRIVNGEIDKNSLGFEPGHQIIDLEKHTSLEDLISGGALKNREGKNAEDIDDKVIWDKVARDLAIGLNNFLVFWSPDVVILGGSVMKSIPLDKVRHYTKEVVKIFPEIPPIRLAKLGDLGGLYGGLAYINHKKS